MERRVKGEKQRTDREGASPARQRAGSSPGSIRLTVNGRTHELEVGRRPDQVDPAETLAETLRQRLGLTGTKVACDHGACGACTVMMNGKATLSCMTLTVECDGNEVTTIEGLSPPGAGKLDPLQQAFVDQTAFQCGFCTPGIIMSAKALLAENRTPSEEEIQQGLSGNFCRCISHYQVVEAVKQAAKGQGGPNGG